MHKYGYLSAFILPLIVVTGCYLGGWYNFIAPLLVFGILTIADYFIGLYTVNVDDENLTRVGDDFFYRFITYLWTYTQIVYIIWACLMVAEGRINTINEWIGFVLGSSLVTGGIGITVAHELGHKKSSIEKFYSKLLLMTVCYMHYHIEHNRGHHVYVATPQDPATSRKNENFYKFWIRCVLGSYANAWKIVNGSWRNKGLSPINIKNEMFWYTILPFLFCVSLTLSISLWIGHLAWEVPLFFFSQSVLAFTMLELVDYIEHYGIVRKLQPDGRYERVNPLHSWNASHRLSNYFLFQLQRHSDHHHNAIKRYQVLYHYNESPQLPFGYPTMIIIALIPPLWFSMMNPLLENWKEKTYKTLATAA